MFPVFYYTPEPEPEPAPEREEKAPAPACCPECWRTEAISPEKAWAAVVAMWGGTSYV